MKQDLPRQGQPFPSPKHLHQAYASMSVCLLSVLYDITHHKPRRTLIPADFAAGRTSEGVLQAFPN